MKVERILLTVSFKNQQQAWIDFSKDRFILVLLKELDHTSRESKYFF